MPDHNDDIKAVSWKNAPENLKLTSPDIQKDVVSGATIETINFIMKDISSGLFSILIDESHDISVKEHIVVVLRYVDENGCVIERFIGVEHIANTITLSLKDVIVSCFLYMDCVYLDCGAKVMMGQATHRSCISF